MCVLLFFFIKDSVGYGSGAIFYARYAVKYLEACKKLQAFKES